MEQRISMAGSDELCESEACIIDYFVRTVRLLGLPKSIGEIYGLLFVSTESLTMDEIVARLRISKGTASQGLRQLREFGAVRAQYVPGDRRDHFVPELSLKRLIAGFLKEQLQPQLMDGIERLGHVRELALELPEEQRAHIERRLDVLASWHGKARTALPVVQNILDRG